MLDHVAPCSGIGVVGFVYDQQLKEVGWDQVQSAGKCLHAGHLHGMGEVHFAVGADATVLHIHGCKAAAGLIQQFGAMDKDADAVALASSGLGNVTKYDGLATAGWQDGENGGMTKLVLESDLRDQRLLIWPELHGVASCELML